MKLYEQQALFARDVARLIAYMFEQGYNCTLGEAYRTPEQAEIYFNQGKGIKNSLHCKRLAIDLNLFDSKGNFLTDIKDHEKFGCFWESLDSKNIWGGRFPKLDANHYQRNME